MIKMPNGSLENYFLPSSRIGGSRVEESLGMNQKPNNGIGTEASTHLAWGHRPGGFQPLLLVLMLTLCVCVWGLFHLPFLVSIYPGL